MGRRANLPWVGNVYTLNNSQSLPLWVFIIFIYLYEYIVSMTELSDCVRWTINKLGSCCFAAGTLLQSYAFIR